MSSSRRITLGVCTLTLFVTVAVLVGVSPQTTVSETDDFPGDGDSFGSEGNDSISDIEKQGELMSEVLRIFTGAIVFLGGVVVLVELLVNRGVRTAGNLLYGRDTEHRFTTERFLGRALTALGCCWLGTAIYLGGTILWWTLGVALACALLAGSLFVHRYTQQYG